MSSQERIYIFSTIDQPGVVAANNFLTLFNPVNSGKLIIPLVISCENYTIGASSTATSMTVGRISSATGGTLVAASTIPRFKTTDDNCSAEVRTGNPTVTNVRASGIGYSPPLSTGAGIGAVITQTELSGVQFILQPGEGLVWSTAAGNTNQVWTLRATWQEVYLPTGV